MIRFEYRRPGSLSDCLALLDEYRERARLIAGGTDLMVELRSNDAKHQGIELLIDISHLSELHFISKQDQEICLGPIVTHREIWESPLIRKHAMFLAEACHSVGSPQIRNMGTIGGSIGTASPASDPVPPLVALNATLTLKSYSREREVSLQGLLTGPYRTGVDSDEIITAIRFPLLPQGACTSFVKLGRRKALAIARMNVAACVVTDSSGLIQEARIVPGSCMPTAIRAEEAETLLLGQEPSEILFEESAQVLAAEMVKASGRRWSTPYKEPVIASLVKRALMQATGVS